MSPTTGLPAGCLWFGKLPTCGDFVRGPQHIALTEALDQWQTQLIERLLPNPRWKLVYDAAPDVPFAVLGPARRVGLVGLWRASRDASGRRFPFVVAAGVPTPGEQACLSHGPVAWTPVWTELSQWLDAADGAGEGVGAGTGMATAGHRPALLSFGDPDAAQARAEVADFLASHSIASLDQMLAAAGHAVSVRQATLAMGLLLQPLAHRGAHGLQSPRKALGLPLVRPAGLRGRVGAYWLSLLGAVGGDPALEWGLFFSQHEGAPSLWVGAQGASAATLQVAIDPLAAAQDGVWLADSDWVDAALQEAQTPDAVRHFANYLRDPGLSLAQVVALYRRAFWGDQA